MISGLRCDQAPFFQLLLNYFILKAQWNFILGWTSVLIFQLGINNRSGVIIFLHYRLDIAAAFAPVIAGLAFEFYFIETSDKVHTFDPRTIFLMGTILWPTVLFRTARNLPVISRIRPHFVLLSCFELLVREELHLGGDGSTEAGSAFKAVKLGAHGLNTLSYWFIKKWFS